MKAIVLAVSLLIIASATGRALDIVTPDGTYKDVKVTKVEAEAVRIMHSEGTALVDFDLLPPAMQAEYGWTPEKSAARKAAKAAEARRIAEEERMLDEDVRRKAAAEAAKANAEQERAEAEERAKQKKLNAAFEAESRKAQQDLIAAAARARAELDRERKAGTGKTDTAPVAQVLGDSTTGTPEVPPPANGVTEPAAGTASEARGAGKSLFQIYKVWIGLGAGFVLVLILFMLPSANKTRLQARGSRGR